MQRQHPNGPDVVPYDTVNNQLIDVPGKVNGGNPAGYALTNGHTYYYPMGRGGQESQVETWWVKWDNAAIITITVEDTDANTDIADYDTTVGNWVQFNPANLTTGYIAASSGTVTNMQLVVAGGTAGGAMIYLNLRGEMRSRLKIVVGGTGGVVRVCTHSKE